MSDLLNKQELPNIIMIICHDLGRYLGCYGAGVSTPNIDGLAADGIKMSNYFCTAAQCSPSRGSIITGKYPHNHGLIGLAHIGWNLNKNEKTLLMYMNEIGYDTHLFGVQHESSDPKALGYYTLHQTGGKAKDISISVNEFLKKYSSRDSENPFYISAGFFEPHRLRDGSFGNDFYESDEPHEVELLPYLPDRHGIRKDIAGLNGMMYAVDEAVGKIRQGLKDTGMERDTLLIFTTDHGLAMPRAKGTCYDPGLETALIMYKPGEFEGGIFYNELLSNVDLLPTLLEYLGCSATEDIDGRSFLSLLKGHAYKEREHIFAEMTWHDKYNPIRSIRTKKYKYIKNFLTNVEVYLPSDIYMGPAGYEVRDEFYGSRRQQEELYDLEKDVYEKENLADNPEYGNVLKELREKIEAWMKDTNDMLLEGDVLPTDRQRTILDEGNNPMKWNT